MKQKHIWEIVIAIALIIILVWFFSQGQKATAPSETYNGNSTTESQQNTNPTNSNPNAATNQLTSTDAISISPQSAGSSITVDNFVMSKAGFLAVYEVGTDNKLGKLVGQSGLLNSGKGQDLEIKANVSVNKKYAAVLYVDSNANKKFDASTDKIVTSGGKSVIAYFSVLPN